MLRRTFVHLPGVGPNAERRLWHAGIKTWEDFADAKDLRLKPEVRDRLAEHLCLSAQRLDKRDARFFRDCLPRDSWWRAYPDFVREAVYLDIETTGMGGWAETTVVGLLRQGRMQVFIKDENLVELPAALADCKLLITFYGSAFDLPFLRRRFADLACNALHLDLCFLLRRLGLRGGLKAVEQRLGIERSEATRGLSSYDAVRLWREWERGSKEALALLLEYNREDVSNLVPLAKTAYEGLWSACLEGFRAWQERHGGRRGGPRP